MILAALLALSLVSCTRTDVVGEKGAEIDIEGYIDARIELERQWIRIPKTAMCVCSTFGLISGDGEDTEKATAETIADRRLSGEQRFLRFRGKQLTNLLLIY